MNNSHRTVLMERPSMLPENMSPQTGFPTKPPELLRSRQIGHSVSNNQQFVEWLEEYIASYKYSHISATGDSILVACEIESPYFDDSLRLIDSYCEEEVDNIFKESVHCAYHKVWRVSAINSLYSLDQVKWLTQSPTCCSRIVSFLKCQNPNLKIYIVEIIQ